MTQPSPTKARRIVIASAPGQLRLRFITAPLGPSDNRTAPPRFDAPPRPNALPRREHEMTEHLLELCTQYQHQGKDELAALIDRIGMRMMQIFLDRENHWESHRENHGTPTEPQELP